MFADGHLPEGYVFADDGAVVRDTPLRTLYAAASAAVVDYTMAEEV